MTDATSSQQHSSKSERLFLLFLSSQTFLPAPIRSLLIRFEEHSFFPLIKYSSNLYTASFLLTSGYRPLVYQWRLPNGKIAKVTITIIPKKDSTHLLCWDLGSQDTAEYLIGSKTNSDIILGLQENLRSGLYMSNSYVAALTYESSPNQDVRLSIVDRLNFSLAKLPIILSSRLSLSSSVTCVADEDLALFATEENPVFIPYSLPYGSFKPKPYFSLWANSKNDEYYRLPNSNILPAADFLIHNCLTSLDKRVDRRELEKYRLTVEEANKYLVPEFDRSLQSAIDYANDFITNQATITNVERTKKLERNVSRADWTQIIYECLGITGLQVKQNPQLVEERIKELLLQFQNLVTDNRNKLEDESAVDLAKATAVKIQAILNSHGFELENSIEQLVNEIGQTSVTNTLKASQTEKSTRLQQAISFFAEVNLVENDLEIIMQEISHKYQELWSDGNLETDVNNQAEYTTKSAKKLVQEVTEKYPLPNFGFDDLI